MRDIDRLVRTCFNQGGTYDHGDGIASDIAVLNVATLRLPSGRLGIVDPTYDVAHFEDTMLVCAELRPGDHAFEAAVFRPRTADGRRLRSLIAAVRVGSAGEGVWRPAWERNGVPLGVSVDSGAVAVFDVAGRPGLPLSSDDGSPESDWPETVQHRGFLISEPDPLLGNMVIYSCALGDGSYTPWVQQDPDGRPRSVVVDMGVLD